MIRMPDWLMQLLIGGVIVSLIGLVYRGILTKEGHLIECNKAKKEMKEAIREEFIDFRNYFDLEVKVKVLDQLKNLNGGLEEKIEIIANRVVSKHTEEIKKEINQNLNLIEVVKALAKKG